MTNGDRTDGRLDRWTARRSARLRGYNPWEIFVDAARTGAEHRLTGLAAEMAFFASLALIPFTAAFGAVLGYVEPLGGTSGVEETERIVTEIMIVILGPDLAIDVAVPFVQAQLSQARGVWRSAGWSPVCGWRVGSSCRRCTGSIWPVAPWTVEPSSSAD